MFFKEFSYIQYIVFSICILCVIESAYSQTKLDLLLNNKSYPNSGYTSQSVVYGEKIIFSARTQEHGNEVWILDSPESEPRLLKDINPGIQSSEPKNFIVFKDRVLFTAKTEDNGYELWTTDGSEKNTFLLEDLFPGSTSSNPVLLKINTTSQFILFTAKLPDIGTELCALVNFETKIKCFDLNLGINSSSPGNITEFKDSMIFNANTTSLNTVLFYNPTLSKTQSLFNGSVKGKVIGGLQGNKLFLNNKEVFLYSLAQADKTTLYLTESTETPGLEITSIAENPDNFIQLDEFAFLFTAKDKEHGIELWRSNGTVEGTYILKDINPGLLSSTPSNFTLLNGIIYFSANTEESGEELWRTDGTMQGTSLLKDIYPGEQASSPANLTLFNNKLYFTAYTKEYGRELFHTDGTKASTTLYKDLREGLDSSNPKDFHTYLNKLVFFAEGNKPSIYFLDSNNSLHSLPILGYGDIGTDISSMIKLSNKLSFLSISDPSVGAEPYIYDNVSNKITLLKDINPGEKSSYPFVIGMIGNKIFFRADNFEHGSELWVTDGTNENTQLLKDINPGMIGSNLLPFGNSKLHNGFLYFLAYNVKHGNEIWRTDGTAKGTKLFLDLNKGSGSAFNNLSVSTELADDIYFSGTEINDSEKVYKLNIQTKSLKKITNSSNDKNDRVYSILKNEDIVLFQQYTKDSGRKLYSYNNKTSLLNDLGSINLTSYLNNIQYLSISGNIIARVSVDNKNYMARFRPPYSKENIDLFKFEYGTEGETQLGEPYLVNNQVIFTSVSSSNSLNLWKLNFSNIQAERLNSTEFRQIKIITENYICNAKKTILIVNVDDNNTELYETDGDTFNKVNIQGATSDLAFFPDITQVKGNDLIILGNNKQYGSELWQITNLFDSNLKCTIETEDPYQESQLRTLYRKLKSFKPNKMKNQSKSIKEIKKSYSIFKKSSKESIKSFTQKNKKQAKKKLSELKSTLKIFYKYRDKKFKLKCMKLAIKLLKFFT